MWVLCKEGARLNFARYYFLNFFIVLVKKEGTLNGSRRNMKWKVALEFFSNILKKVHDMIPKSGTIYSSESLLKL